MTRYALGLALSVVAHDPTVARACAPAFPNGSFVSIASEEALIVWDAATRTEHFVRRAHFESDADDFGFLVPTPAPPELAEADDSVFDRLRTEMVPEVREGESTYVPTTCCLLPVQFLMLSAGAERAMPSAQVATPEVEVLSTARVAGMDATVLRAADAGALTAWLEDRGYAVRPELTAWVAPYVERGFAITAFRYVKGDASSTTLGSRAVRLTFHTDAPFYPYREPTDQPNSPKRSLRVFFVGEARHEGRLTTGAPLGARTEHAAPLSAGVLHGAVPDADATREGLFMTSLVDESVRRASADLTFVPNGDGEVRAPPITAPGPEIPLPIPIEPVLVGGAGVYFWRRRKARRAA